MMNLFRLIFAIFIIVLTAPQTPKQNIVLKALHSKRILANYGAEKHFLIKLTWFSILLFLVIGFFSSVK